MGAGWGQRAPNIPVSSASKQNPQRLPASLRRLEANLSPCFGSTLQCVSWSLVLFREVLSAGAPGQLGPGSNERSGRCTRRQGWPHQTSCPTPARTEDVSRVSAVQPQGRVLNNLQNLDGGFVTRLPFLSLPELLIPSYQEKELFNEKHAAVAFPRDFGCSGIFSPWGLSYPYGIYGGPSVQSVLIGPQQSEMIPNSYCSWKNYVVRETNHSI